MTSDYGQPSRLIPQAGALDCGSNKTATTVSPHHVRHMIAVRSPLRTGRPWPMAQVWPQGPSQSRDIAAMRLGQGINTPSLPQRVICSPFFQPRRSPTLCRGLAHGHSLTFRGPIQVEDSDARLRRWRPSNTTSCTGAAGRLQDGRVAAGTPSPPSVMAAWHSTPFYLHCSPVDCLAPVSVKR